MGKAEFTGTFEIDTFNIFEPLKSAPPRCDPKLIFRFLESLQNSKFDWLKNYKKAQVPVNSTYSFFLLGEISIGTKPITLFTSRMKAILYS